MKKSILALVVVAGLSSSVYAKDTVVTRGYRGGKKFVVDHPYVSAVIPAVIVAHQILVRYYQPYTDFYNKYVKDVITIKK